MSATPSNSPTSRADDGFSLIEMLVGLAIGALIIATVPGMLRLGQRALQSPADVDRLAVRDAGLAFVEQRLGEAIPAIERRAEGRIGVAFTGAEETLEFVAPSRTGRYGSGVYRFRLQTRVGATGGYDVVLEHALYRPSGAVAQSEWAVTRRVLLTTDSQPRLRYFGVSTEDAPRQWHTQWSRTDRLPDLVELRLASSGIAMEHERTIVAAPMRR